MRRSLQCHWQKWFMTKTPTSCAHRATALGMIFPLVFMFGCGSTPQPDRSIPVMAALETHTEVKVESLPADTPNQPEQNVLAEVDEKNSNFFSLGSSTLNQREKDKLRNIASLLKNDKALCATLIGHAYDNGSRSFNLAVADARVESVSAILKKLGVKSRQIKKVVNGGEKPPTVCQSAECRRMMRRVELVFSREN